MNKMKTKFKVLMYANQFVNEKMLLTHYGIYTTDKPKLYRFDMTIEKIIEDDLYVITNLLGTSTEKYLELIKQCKLVEVDLIINK